MAFKGVSGNGETLFFRDAQTMPLFLCLHEVHGAGESKDKLVTAELLDGFVVIRKDGNISTGQSSILDAFVETLVQSFSLAVSIKL